MVIDVPQVSALCDLIALDVQPAWPYHLVLTPSCKMAYGAVFRHLFRLRMVQYLLDSVWRSSRPRVGVSSSTSSSSSSSRRRATKGGEQKRGNKEDDADEGQERSSPAALLDTLFWVLGQQMSSLVGNLLLYMQLDVIEVQYHKLVESVGRGTSFGEVEHAHQTFLVALLEQSLLNHAPFRSFLRDVYKCCFMLSGFHQRRLRVRARATGGGRDEDETSTLTDELMGLKEVWEGSLTQLYVVLSGNRFTRELELRLSSNGYLWSLYRSRREGTTRGGPPKRVSPR